jgi:hypothetical protein
MPTSREYLRHAEDSRRLAAQTGDLTERESLLRIAAQWVRLAQHKAKREVGHVLKIPTETLPGIW